MTNEVQEDNQEAVDPNIFDEWLSQTADSKGLSKNELMDQMLSSYWILDELTELVDGVETGQGSTHPSVGPTELASESNTGAETTGADETTEPSSTAGDSPPAGHTETSDATLSEENVREIQTAIRELIETQWTAELPQPSELAEYDSSTPSDQEADSVSEIRDRLDILASDLEDIESRQDSQVERFTSELQLVLDRVDELERQQDQYASKSDIAALSEAIEKLNNRVETLRATTDNLGSEMDDEFDSVEKLFHRMLDALDDLDSDIESATESYKDELQPIQQRQAEQKQLEALKTEAMEHGVRTGVCESCGGDIDLTLLESPTCPNCTDHLIGIDDGGWNPFRSVTFETEGALTDDGSIRPLNE